ncbi:Secretory carrier-associated membrane protein 2 [Tyrophagus putrescentiae]|nr:Secretory carrier-associated membrane protein 2 [Tyrophagus putrescentiae]
MSTYSFSNDPFADPTIAAATNQNNISNGAGLGGGGLEDYNPFANQATRNVDPFSPVTNTAPGPIESPAAAVLSPSNTFAAAAATTTRSNLNDLPPPPSYSSATTTTANTLTAEQLRQRQEELDRRAAELAAREAELQRAQRATAPRENNFPPLPSFFPCTPCFYQDINVEIEIDFQGIVRQVFQLWLFYVGTLLVNFIACLVSLAEGVDNGIGMVFFAIITIVIFTPLSFLFWFRPLYKAFRDDSSFNFMVFFFVFFCQLMLSIFWALGVPWHRGGVSVLHCVDPTAPKFELSNLLLIIFSSGLFTAIGSLTNSNVGVFYRLICFATAAVLIAYCLASLYILLKVRSIYSNSSASFEKAQAEFTTKVLSNDGVRQMASSAAQTAARQAMNQAFTQQPQGGNVAGGGGGNPNAGTGFRY